MRFGRLLIKTILTIAGFDPSSGAGITADLAVIAVHGFFGTSAITALTVQSTLGVRGMYPVASGILDDTLKCLLEDLHPIGVKIGMLGNADAVRVVTDHVRRLQESKSPLQVVLDPVIRSSSGRELLDARGMELLQRELLPIVDWVTPNLDELRLLAGVRVESADDIEAAVELLRGRCKRLNVVATGGHLEAANDFVALSDGRREWMRDAKIASNATHGTGCAFSSALVCGVADGGDGILAARRAKEFVAQAIRQAPGIGHGKGPMELFWPLKSKR